MNKNIKKFLGSTLIFSSIILSSVSVSARQIGSLHGFKLPAYQRVVSTGLLKKATTGTTWILNITGLNKASTVDTYLANGDGARRGDYTRVGVGRHQINSGKGPTRAYQGYHYKAVFMNSRSQSTDGYITGSWSPDAQ